MISSTVFLAAVLNAEELTAPAPMVDAESESSDVELVDQEVTDERRLGGYPNLVGGENGLPPRWILDPTFEKPHGTVDHGTSTSWIYTPEQQERLGVDENGESTFDLPGGDWESQIDLGRISGYPSDDMDWGFGRRLDYSGWSSDDIHYAGLLGVRLPESPTAAWKDWRRDIGVDWSSQMPRFIRDKSFEMPKGEEDLVTSSRWVYTPEQQARLGVDKNGEDVRSFGNSNIIINSAPIGGNWREQMPRWIRDPTFEKPQGEECQGADCSSTGWFYTPEQQYRLGVDRNGEDAFATSPTGLPGRRRFGGHHIMGQCQCSNGLTGMFTQHGCVNCKPMPGQCQCPNGDWNGMVTSRGCEGCSMAGQCTCSDGFSKGMLVSGGQCVGCPPPMAGQCTCSDGFSKGMLVSGGRCVGCPQEPPMAGQCTCSDGFTKGMLVSGGHCAGCPQERPISGQCTCPDGFTTGMLVSGGRCVGCGGLTPPGQCTCSDGSTGMLVLGGHCVCANPQPSPAPAGQCTCSDGSMGMLVSGGQCICTGPLFGR